MNVVNMRFRLRAVRRFISDLLNGTVLVLFLLGALVVTAILLPQSAGVSLDGRARASDGDTIRLNAERIRILGIDAPELAQTCTDANGRDWPCGQAAKERMTAMLDQGEVHCVSQGRDKYGRALASCTVNGRDIALQMVRDGLAVSYHDYKHEQALARASRRGLWSGTFVLPRDWRDGHRNQKQNEDPWQWLWDLFQT